MIENKLGELGFPILFSKLSKSFNKRFGDYLIPFGLSKLHAYYLMCLYKNKNGLTLNQLNIMTGCDKANTSRAINDMADKGIVERSGQECEKKYRVVLTKKGFDIGKDFMHSIKDSIKNTFSVLTEKELEFFQNIVKKLAKEAC